MSLMYWHWLTIGLLLILAETLGASGFLLALGMAAFLNAFLVWMFQLDWQWQLVMYASFSIFFAFFWWSIWKRSTRFAGQNHLNQPAVACIGRTTSLVEAIDCRRGKVVINDAHWIVTGPDLPVGQKVRVVGVEESVILVVEPVEDKEEEIVIEKD